MTHTFLLTLLIALCAPAAALAETDPDLDHGPRSKGGFSHHFSRRAHMPKTPQLSFHYGLLQPAVLRGFNAAVDVRYQRFIGTYSHGQGLDFSSLGSPEERDAGVAIDVPWSTGFGVGSVLVDELYLLADFKVHSAQASLEGQSLSYKTLTLGLELGYRLFLYRGFHVAGVLRYWPTVWSSVPRDSVEIGDTGVEHQRIEMGAQGFFANVLIGWAFQL